MRAYNNNYCDYCYMNSIIACIYCANPDGSTIYRDYANLPPKLKMLHISAYTTDNSCRRITNLPYYLVEIVVACTDTCYVYIHGYSRLYKILVNNITNTASISYLLNYNNYVQVFYSLYKVYYGGQQYNIITYNNQYPSTSVICHNIMQYNRQFVDYISYTAQSISLSLSLFSNLIEYDNYPISVTKLTYMDRKTIGTKYRNDPLNLLKCR
jgi:hypothetical protein